MPVNYLFISYKCFLRYGISIGFLEVMAMVWSIGRLKGGEGCGAPRE